MKGKRGFSKIPYSILILVLSLFFLLEMEGKGIAHSAEAVDRSSSTPSLRMNSIIKTHVKKIRSWVKNPILVNATIKQNEKQVPFSEIQKIDNDWVAGKADLFALELQKNEAGEFLRNKILSNGKLYVEAFLCDNQGAIVGEYPKTSDYWQGDEDKFIKSYNNGNGEFHQSEITYDESTKTFSVQVSIPIVENGKAIGVLIVGLRNIQ